MLQLITNPTFHRAVTSATVNLVKVGCLTVASVWVSKQAHESGKNLLNEMVQHFRLIRHEVSN